MGHENAKPEGRGFRFRRVEIGEPIRVLVGQARTAADVAACLAELRARVETPLVLALNVPAGLGEEELPGVLRAAAALADRLVLTADERGPQTWGRVPLSDLGGLCRGERGALVFIDPVPGRAIVGTMQGLGAGETFAVLWPAGPRAEDADSLVVQGARWRAAWEAPEDGEFHWLPPEPNGL